MEQDDDNQSLILGILFGIIVLVIALLIGVTTYATRQANAAKPVAGAADIAEVGAPLVKLYFDSGKADLPALAGDELAKVTAKLAAEPGKRVLLSGYHDETGGAAVNAEIAKARALAVKTSLVAAGVAEDKVAMRKPALTLGGTDAAEARRVEIRVQ